MGRWVIYKNETDLQISPKVVFLDAFYKKKIEKVNKFNKYDWQKEHKNRQALIKHISRK